MKKFQHEFEKNERLEEIQEQLARNSREILRRMKERKRKEDNSVSSGNDPEPEGRGDENSAE